MDVLSDVVSTEDIEEPNTLLYNSNIFQGIIF